MNATPFCIGEINWILFKQVGFSKSRCHEEVKSFPRKRLFGAGLLVIVSVLDIMWLSFWGYIFDFSQQGVRLAFVGARGLEIKLAYCL